MALPCSSLMDKIVEKVSFESERIEKTPREKQRWKNRTSQDYDGFPFSMMASHFLSETWLISGPYIM